MTRPHEMVIRWRPGPGSTYYTPEAIASYAEQLRAKGFDAVDDGDGGLLIKGYVRFGPVEGRPDAVGELVPFAPLPGSEPCDFYLQPGTVGPKP